MRRLFKAAPQGHDIRPTVLSVAGLMLLLLPLTLLSTSLDKRTGLPIGLLGGEGEVLQSDGVLEQLKVRRVDAGFVVEAQVRTTDVRAASGDVEHRAEPARDLGELQSVLGRMKLLDPTRTQLTLVPAASSTTAQVVRWMDTARRGPQGELFPKVVLEVQP
jgi:hypothetical protein